MYKNTSFSSTFLNLPNFDRLSRPDKLLLVGLYDQWTAHNCLPMRMSEIDHKALIRLSGIANLNMSKLPEKKMRSLMRFGVLFSDNTVAFVVKPIENKPVDLTKSKNGKLRKKVNRSNANGKKTSVTGKKVSVRGQKTSVIGKKPAAKTETQEAVAPKKRRLHPNFSATVAPKKESDKK